MKSSAELTRALFDQVRCFSSLSTIDSLLQQGAEVVYGKTNVSILMLTIAVQNTDAARFLIEEKQSSVDVNFSSRSGWAALLVAVSMNEASVVALLIKHGARVNQRFADKTFPLFIAVVNRNTKIVQLLLTHETVDTNAVDACGNSCLAIASRSGSLGIVAI